MTCPVLVYKVTRLSFLQYHNPHVTCLVAPSTHTDNKLTTPGPPQPVDGANVLLLIKPDPEEPRRIPNHPHNPLAHSLNPTIFYEVRPSLSRKKTLVNQMNR